MSGYISHVVHNMSTLKLMNPNKSYGQHFSEYVAKSEKRFPTTWSPGLRKFFGYFGNSFLHLSSTVFIFRVVGFFSDNCSSQEPLCSLKVFISEHLKLLVLL